MKFLNKALNIIFPLIFLLLLIQKGPALWEQYQREGKPLPEFEFINLDGERHHSKELPKPLLIVFWATWCPPCEIELNRIQRLISNERISPKSVLAISSYENQNPVRETSQNRQYTFPIALDEKGLLAKLFQIKGTPTVILVSPEGRMTWITTGLSPSLEIRVLKTLALD